MPYPIEVAPAARRALGRLTIEVQQKIDLAILALESNPRPSGCVKLSGGLDLWRIGAGDYRIVYQIRDKTLLVLVVRIGHRRDVYR